MSTHRSHHAAARQYAAGLTDQCQACLRACPEHGVTGCRLCHTHPGECGYGGCTEPEQLLAIDYWQDSETVTQRRVLCVQHMRYWRHECLDDIDRTIQPTNPGSDCGPVRVVQSTGDSRSGETLPGARLALRRLREESDYAGVCVEELTASLRRVSLDAVTLAEVAAVTDAAEQMSTAAARALSGVEARHQQMEEAVAATPHPAKTSFYRHRQESSR